MTFSLKLRREANRMLKIVPRSYLKERRNGGSYNYYTRPLSTRTHSIRYLKTWNPAYTMKLLTRRKAVQCCLPPPLQTTEPFCHSRRALFNTTFLENWATGSKGSHRVGGWKEKKTVWVTIGDDVGETVSHACVSIIVRALRNGQGKEIYRNSQGNFDFQLHWLCDTRTTRIALLHLFCF